MKFYTATLLLANLARYASAVEGPGGGGSMQGGNGGGGGYYNYGQQGQQQYYQQQQQGYYGQQHQQQIQPIERGNYDSSTYQSGMQQQQQYNDEYQRGYKEEQRSNDQKDLASTQVTEGDEEQPLPEGWTEYIDQGSGRPYYYNSVTGETTWTRPVPPESQPSNQTDIAINMETSEIQNEGGEDTTDRLLPSGEKNNEGPSQGSMDISTSKSDDQTEQNDMGMGYESSYSRSYGQNELQQQEKVPSERMDESNSWSEQQQQTQPSKDFMGQKPSKGQYPQQQGWGLPSQQQAPSQGWGLPDKSSEPKQEKSWEQRQQQQQQQPPAQEDRRQSSGPQTQPQWDQQQKQPQRRPPNSPNQHYQQQWKQGGPDMRQQQWGQQPQPNYQQVQQQFGQTKHPDITSNQQEGEETKSLGGFQIPFFSKRQNDENEEEKKEEPPKPQHTPQNLGAPPQQSLGGYGHAINQGGQSQPTSWQQKPPPQYGAQYQSGPGSFSNIPNQYGQQSNQPSGQLQPYQAQPQESTFSSVLEGLRGFGERARETVNQAKDTVVQQATHVSENVSAQSSGFFSRARAQVESLSKTLFDGGETQGDDSYSMSPYGSSPHPNQPQMPQGQQQIYPPQNYGGYPPGYGPPGPRVSQPYPHNPNQSPQQMQPPPGVPKGPPLQSQWGQQQAGGQWQGQQGQVQRPQPGQGFSQQRPPVDGVRSQPPQGSNQQGGGNPPPKPQQQQGGYPNPNQHPGWSSF